MSAALSRRDFLSAASLLCAAMRLRAQDDPIFSTSVKVVDLLAIVRTKKGEIVRDLSKDDFTISENGRRQTIRYFSKESDLPLTIGLLVDTSYSQNRLLDAERKASFDFLDHILREAEDQVFLMQFDMAILVRQPLTSSRSKLEEELTVVDTPTRRELEQQGTAPGTRLYDAVEQASRDFMNNQRNRKALILLTDGVDTGSDASLESAIEAAQRAGTLVYSILFSDSGFYGFFGGPDGRKVLRRLAQETGGTFFEVSKKQSLETVYSLIEQELRSQYSLGFVSDQPVRVSEFRSLQLATTKKGLIVQTRDRYWAQR